MPASIFEGRLVLNRKPAWHGLGTVMDRPVSAVEAADISGVAAVRYAKKNVSYLDAEAGRWVELPEVALFREPTEASPRAYLGLVKPDFPVMSNHRLAEILDPLSRHWPIETCGLLGDGDTVFFTLQAEPVTIAGDDCNQFFVLVDYKTPGKALRLMETKVRIVCQNTLMAAISAASMSLRIPHKAGQVEADTAFYVDLRERMVRAQASSTEAFERMAQTPMTMLAHATGLPDPVAAVLGVVFPAPRTPSKLTLVQDAQAALSLPDADLTERERRMRQDYERQREAASSKRTDVVALYDRFNDEHPVAARSAWALYNAVVEYADHRVGYKENYTTAYRSQEALFGGRALEKERAYKALTDAAYLVRAGSDQLVAV